MVVEGANATELGAWPRSITPPMKHRHLARWNIDGMVFVLLVEEGDDIDGACINDQ